MIFSQRSNKKELLDGEKIPFADIRQNLEELDFINKWLGGHAITLNAFKSLLRKRRSISVCEIGCGGGDNLIAIQKWCSPRNIQLKITGIDIKQECIEFAESRQELQIHATLIKSDFKDVSFKNRPDVIFSSLFCHHFTHCELIQQLSWMKENCKIGFFINDLERNYFAYLSIKLLTKIFSNSYLVKNDAPLSVERGFTRNELLELCRQANIERAEVSWKWAFRYLVLFEHERAKSL